MILTVPPSVGFDGEKPKVPADAWMPPLSSAETNIGIEDNNSMERTRTAPDDFAMIARGNPLHLNQSNTLVVFVAKTSLDNRCEHGD